MKKLQSIAWWVASVLIAAGIGLWIYLRHQGPVKTNSDVATPANKVAQSPPPAPKPVDSHALTKEELKAIYRTDGLELQRCKAVSLLAAHQITEDDIRFFQDAVEHADDWEKISIMNSIPRALLLECVPNSICLSLLDLSISLQESHTLRALSRATALLCIPGQSSISEGTIVNILTLLRICGDGQLAELMACLAERYRSGACGPISRFSQPCSRP